MPTEITPQVEGLMFTRHPVADQLIPPLSLDQQKEWLRRPNGSETLMEYWEQHEGLINDAKEEPLSKGFELPFWGIFRKLFADKDELYALGGNGPGKTEIGGKLAVEALTERSERNVLCVAKDENVSKQLQQKAIYKYLPGAYRQYNERIGSRRRGVVTKVTYSQANGFTEGTFVLPNKSQCYFKTVEQYERKNDVFEGPEYDFVWIDEPSPIEMVNTLSYRVGKRGGKFLFTFTAVNGFDAVCKAILQGAKMVKSLPMNWQWKINSLSTTVRDLGEIESLGAPDPQMAIPELNLEERQIKELPAGHMPFIMQPMNKSQGIIFLWTHWNLFLERSKENPHLPAYFDKCVRKPKSTVRMRLFGWTEKLTGSQFPNFNSNVHVIPHERIAEMIKLGKVSAFKAADPATARSYFLLWCACDAQGRKFIFDESPRYEEGEWVSEDGKAGDGQMLYGGRGVNFYKGYIRLREHEHGITPLRRWGDPRAFATEAAAADGGTSLFSLFEAEGPAGVPELEPMYFEPAKVMRSLLAEANSGSLDKINDALAYDVDKPITVENEPKLYISDRCQNLIRAILNWSPEQGDKSPWKDPIDTLRYLFGEEMYYSDPGIAECVGGRGWGAR